jgi:hypothetical protein
MNEDKLLKKLTEQEYHDLKKELATEIDFEKLRHELRTMKTNSPLLKVLIEELPKLNYRIRNAIALTLLPNILSNMKRWQSIYKIVKQILSRRGNWQDKARGNPKLGFKTGFGKHRE